MSEGILSTPIIYKANGEEVKLSGQMVKQYLVRGNGNVTDQEIVMFMNLAKYQHLNPFLNEAYLVKFGNSPASIITSKEAFMKRANSNPHYKGIKAGIMVARGDEIVQLNGAVKLPKDVLIGGWATVKRDDREDTHIEIAFNEFSKAQATWKSMPSNMIRKSAMVNALREAFPETLGDMYTEDDKNLNDHMNARQTVQATESTPSNVKDIISKAVSETVKKTQKAKSVDDKPTAETQAKPDSAKEPEPDIVNKGGDPHDDQYLSDEEQQSIFEAINEK
ncbi:phage recombination protein Bet [Secundilactobacillus paracollinoides]|uniref:phage recombination protein Bet n=1 Tax=Secundilactobacillus paracollinoides TaxID=240427 RepID=UPI00081C08C0|nr:phage recombination protein Bet [Secundilactobacillus paracollinoides]